jgi:dienelactone hydrolase
MSTDATVAPEFGSLLWPYLDGLAARLFARNRELRSAVRTAEDWWQRRGELRAAFVQALGAFPDRTPLNAKVVGVLESPGFVIEKIVFESRPGFYVTANLYRPDEMRAAVPGVLVPCGHSENGKAYAMYQAACIGFALKGYVALIYDPLGQGERKQYWDPVEGRSAIGHSCPEHCQADNLCRLTGMNVAQYMVWDSIRAIDYLLTREEVDPARIGCTGCSGGGTNTSYVAALDERIQVAAPVCYVTTLQAREQTLMIADGEQNLEAQVLAGLDHHEYGMMAAPRAIQVQAAEQDFFPLAGARESAAATAALYETLGILERASLAVLPGEHGFSAEARNSVYAWFDRWFGVESAPIPNPEQFVRPDEALYCTPTGQLATSLRGETVFSLNARRALEIIPPEPLLADAASARAYQGRIIEAAKRLTAYEPPEQADFRVLGEEDRGTYRRLRLAIGVGEGLEIPAYALIPAQTSANRRPIVYAGDEGAATATHLLSPLAALCAEESVVILAVDVRGMGESADPQLDAFRDADEAMRRLLGGEAYADYHCRIIGKPLLGQRVADLVAAANGASPPAPLLTALCASRRGENGGRLPTPSAACGGHSPSLVGRGENGISPLALLPRREGGNGGRQRQGADDRVELIGSGRCGVVALHAAAICERFASVTVQRSLWSYRLATQTKLYVLPHGADTLHGVIGEYDLPDLAAAIAPRQVRIEAPVDAMGRSLCAPELPAAHASDYRIAQQVHSLVGGRFGVWAAARLGSREVG